MSESTEDMVNCLLSESTENRVNCLMSELAENRVNCLMSESAEGKLLNVSQQRIISAHHKLLGIRQTVLPKLHS